MQKNRKGKGKCRVSKLAVGVSGNRAKDLENCPTRLVTKGMWYGGK